MSSKIIGYESDFFAKLSVKAMGMIKTKDIFGNEKYPVKNINILKSHG